MKFYPIILFILFLSKILANSFNLTIGIIYSNNNIIDQTIFKSLNLFINNYETDKIKFNLIIKNYENTNQCNNLLLEIKNNLNLLILGSSIDCFSNLQSILTETNHFITLTSFEMKGEDSYAVINSGSLLNKLYFCIFI